MHQYHFFINYSADLTKIMVEEKDKIRKIMCPYCSAPYTGDMLHQLWVCDESYTPGCTSARAVSRIEIKCRGCKKIVYVKEIEENFGADDVMNLIANRDEE